jgi:hypothetical protein
MGCFTSAAFVIAFSLSLLAAAEDEVEVGGGGCADLCA